MQALSIADEQILRVVIVAFDDFTDIDLILIWDLLNRVTSRTGVCASSAKQSSIAR